MSIMASMKKASTLMRPYWLSWVSRPEHGPYTLEAPWWISGYDPEDHPTVCAAVMAPSEGHARLLIIDSHDDPSKAMHARFRFVERMEPGWEPFGERFARRDWMKWPWPEE